jgi:hypothetical protein
VSGEGSFDVEVDAQDANHARRVAAIQQGIPESKVLYYSQTPRPTVPDSFNRPKAAAPVVEKNNSSVLPFLAGAATGYIAARATEPDPAPVVVIAEDNSRFERQQAAIVAAVQAEEKRREQLRRADEIADYEEGQRHVAKWKAIKAYEVENDPSNTFWFPESRSSYRPCWEIVATGFTAFVGEPLFKFTGKTHDMVWVECGGFFRFRTEQQSFEDTFKVSPYFSRSELETFTIKEEKRLAAEYNSDVKNAEKIIEAGRALAEEFGKDWHGSRKGSSSNRAEASMAAI